MTVTSVAVVLDAPVAADEIVQIDLTKNGLLVGVPVIYLTGEVGAKGVTVGGGGEVYAFPQQYGIRVTRTNNGTPQLPERTLNVSIGVAG